MTTDPNQPEAQGESREYDEAIEAVRRAFCALPRYSFLLDNDGNVRRVPTQTGNWLDFQSVHALFDTEVVDGLIAKERASAAINKAAGSPT